MEENFRTYYIDDVYVVEPYNTARETIQHWEQAALARLDACTTYEKRLYDLRFLSGLSMYALRMIVRLRTHPNAQLVYTAVVTPSNLVTDLIKSLIHRRENVRIFDNQEEAINWLNTATPTP